MSALYLVRHGSAGDRDRWTGADELRPLDEEGWRQAKALVGMFDHIGLARLISSPALRCIQTFEPLVAQRELAIERSEDLAEGTPSERAIALMLGLVSEHAALCSHGDVIEGVVHHLVGLGMSVDGSLGFAKG